MVDAGSKAGRPCVIRECKNRGQLTLHVLKEKRMQESPWGVFCFPHTCLIWIRDLLTFVATVQFELVKFCWL